MTHTERIDEKYFQKLTMLSLPAKNRSEKHILLDMHGDGKRAPTNFNIQVYKNKKGRLTLVTTDIEMLQKLLEGKEKISYAGKRVILIDDSGWGFPLGGVLCGAYDTQTRKFYVREIEVEHFQGEKYQRRTYLDRYKDRVLEIINEIKPPLSETVVKICTGHINTTAKDALRKIGFLVEVDEIGEPLQNWLESQHKTYIEKLLGADIYYDPKGTSKAEVPRRFEEVIYFAKEHNLMHLAKTGWGYFQETAASKSNLLNFSVNNKRG